MLKVNTILIPRDMKVLDRWVLWRSSARANGGMNKLPIDKNNPWRKVNDLSNCESWEIIEKKLARIRDVGLGFYPDGDHTGLVGVDLDHVFMENMRLKPYALDIVKRLNSYTELSPSGSGLHIWVRSQRIPVNRHGDGVEIMARGNKYLTVTGRLFGGQTKIYDRTVELTEITDEYLPTKEEKPQKRDQVFLQPEDEQILRKLWSNMKARDLWNGIMDDYANDHSSADLALCNYLYLCANQNMDPVDRLFRRSGLMRDKWDEVHDGSGRTYGEMTLSRVRTVKNG